MLIPESRLFEDKTVDFGHEGGKVLEVFDRGQYREAARCIIIAEDGIFERRRNRRDRFHHLDHFPVKFLKSIRLEDSNDRPDPRAGNRFSVFLSVAPPVDVLDTESIDFGRVEQNDIVEHIIHVENEGEDLLVIREVDAS